MAYIGAGALLVTTGTVDPTSGNVAVPGGIADGDFLLMVVRNAAADATVATPSGWTAITAHELTSGTQTDMRLFYRIASSEPGTYSVSNSGQGSVNNQFIAQILAWDAATFETSGTWAASGGSTTIECPSVTSGGASRRLICVYGQYGNGSYTGPYTAPSGMTELVDSADSFSPSGSYTSFGVADKAITSSGATGTQNATAASADTWHLAASVLIEETGGGGSSAGAAAHYYRQMQ